ncbi:V-type ATPase, G subunit [Cryptococcus deuterogattii CA1014]|nr:V-type ATPase, G subunit [Cryptococcus deuterogattii CA1014]
MDVDASIIAGAEMIIGMLSKAANSQGIQTLLEAEKEAAKVVQKARQYRVQKLKDARSEAAKEIEAYKARKEEEFKRFESERPDAVWPPLSQQQLTREFAQHTSQTSTSQTSIDSTTKTQLSQLDDAVAKNKEKVIKKIVSRVLQSEPHLHPNLKKLEA